ncbi:MAG: agmatine deiminase family protein [Firmicutes bacterium]|nr:agmatine deiminase family protein [Bacillota bacterium]
MKAEFNKHACTVLLYPHASKNDVWRLNAKIIRNVVIELAKVVSQFEPVLFGYGDIHPSIRQNNISLGRIDYDDIWVRDTGPIPLRNNKLVIFGFDGWGGLSSDFVPSQIVSSQIADKLNLSIVNTSEIVLEGGNISSDGKGTALVIKERVLSSNKKSLDEIESELKKCLDLNRIIWIERGLIYDETETHVDNLCVFASETQILLAWTDDKQNPQYDVVHEAFDILSKTEYEIIKVPIPDIFKRTEDDCIGIKIVQGNKARIMGEPIQASYINFMFVNGGIILPQFNAPQDKNVLELFKQIFPSRQIVPFNAREVILGGGGLHCISRNI